MKHLGACGWVRFPMENESIFGTHPESAMFRTQRVAFGSELFSPVSFLKTNYFVAMADSDVGLAPSCVFTASTARAMFDRKVESQ